MKKTKAFYPDTKLYTILFIFSLALLGVNFIPNITGKYQNLITSIGTGALASVIVAWLIDYSNCLEKNRLNRLLHRKIFEILDIKVQAYLKMILMDCEKNNSSISHNVDYTIEQIAGFLSDSNNITTLWEECIISFGETFSKIDPIVFCKADNEQDIEIYDILNECRSLVDQYKQNHRERYAKDDKDDTTRFFLHAILINLTKLYKARGDNVIISLANTASL